VKDPPTGIEFKKVSLSRREFVTLVNMVKPPVARLQIPQRADWSVIVVIIVAWHSSIKAIRCLMEGGYMRVGEYSEE